MLCRSFQRSSSWTRAQRTILLEIAAEFPNVKIHHEEFKGFGPLHNEATALASNDWILSIDSDEVLTPELIREIKAYISTKTVSILSSAITTLMGKGSAPVPAGIPILLYDCTTANRLSFLMTLSMRKF